jgi:5'-nucleotidase
MKSNQIILIDMDGVIVDYMSHLLSVLKQRFYFQKGIDPKLLTTRYRDINCPMLDDMFTCPKTRKYIEETAYTPGMFANPLPIPGAVEAVSFLSEHFNIRFCSKPFSGYVDGDHGWSEKVTWIRKHFGKEWVDRIILTRDKTLIHGAILIDDMPEISGDNIDPPWQHLLFYQPWNREQVLKGADFIPSWGNPEYVAIKIEKMIASRFVCMPE